MNISKCRLLNSVLSILIIYIDNSYINKAKLNNDKMSNFFGIAYVYRKNGIINLTLDHTD